MRKGLDLDTDPNWGKLQDPDPLTIYLDPQQWYNEAFSCRMLCNLFQSLSVLPQVEERSAELDKVRNKVNQLESSSSKSPKPNPVVSKQTQTESSTTSSKSDFVLSSSYNLETGSSSKVEPRVTFDLGPTSKLPTAAAAAGSSEQPPRRPPLPVDKPPSQLPSDARQRLQEMAGLDIRRNYRKNSETFQRPAQLNLTTTANSNSHNNVNNVHNGGASRPLLASSVPTATNVSATVAGRSSPTKAYPIGAVMPTTELNNHHVKSSNNSSSSVVVGGGGVGAGPTVIRRDSRSNARNSLVVTVQNSNNQKRPVGGAGGGGGGREFIMNNPTRNAINEAVMNNPPRNAINGTRTRTPSIERSIISNKDDQKDANKVRPKSFWGGWWKF